ncbi:MAG: hypothetical protein GY941_23320 [Planctomycetes bacterium]|nr:hypothetical protein [Planctomycetota bacterium]
MADTGNTVLSSEEVESLLVSLIPEDKSGGESDRSEEEDYTYYDFERPNTVSREKKRLLYKLYENTAYQISRGVSNFLRTTVKITLDDIKEVTFGIFKQSCEDMLYIGTVKLKPLQGFGCITLGLSLCMTMVEVAFGGSTKNPNEIRKPTDLEISIIGNVVSIVLEKLKSSWEQYQLMNWRVAETSVESRYLNIATESDLLLVVSFTVNLDYAFGEMKFCVPVASMDNLLDRMLDSTKQGDSGVDRKKDGEVLEKLVDEIPVEVVGVLDEIHISINDLVNLKTGDVIRLGSKVTDNLKISVEAINKFSGKLGLLGSKKAMQISSVSDGGSYE